MSTVSSSNTVISTGGVTLTFDKGTYSNWPNITNGLVRFYAGNILTVSCETAGKVIKSIVFTYGSSYANTDLSLTSGQSGTYNASSDTWTGSSSSVQFTNANSGQTRFYRIVVTIDEDNGSSGGGDTPTVCDATIVFKSLPNNTGDSGTDMSSDPSSMRSNVESGTNYITSFSDASKVYQARTNYGWKLGSSGATGYFRVNLAAQAEGWHVTKIKVNALRWGTSEGSLKVSTSANTTGTTIDLTPNSSFTDYEVTFDGSDITWFSIATTTKRAFVKSVTLYIDCEEHTDPTLSVSNNNLTINVPYDQSSATATFTVTGANLVMIM